jgi:flagellar biosynthesis protein FliQ
MDEKKKYSVGSNFWQIILPTLLGAVLIILVGLWFVLFAGPGNVSRFAEISTVLLVIPVLFFALLIGLILAGMIYAVTWIMDWIPRLTAPVLTILEKIRQAAGMLSKNSARLVIEPASWMAVFRREKPRADQEIQLD